MTNKAEEALYAAQYEMVAWRMQDTLHRCGVNRATYKNDFGTLRNEVRREFQFFRYVLPNDGERVIIVAKTEDTGWIWEYRHGESYEQNSLFYQKQSVSGLDRKVREFGEYNIDPTRRPEGDWTNVDVFVKFDELLRQLETAERVPSPR